MNEEINKDWYCTVDAVDNTGKRCGLFYNSCIFGSRWGNCVWSHRKYPTPEQFKEEYGYGYPSNGAVYALFENKWIARTLEAIEHNQFLHVEKENIVCACTPWGCPPDSWKKEDANNE